MVYGKGMKAFVFLLIALMFPANALALAPIPGYTTEKGPSRTVRGKASVNTIFYQDKAPSEWQEMVPLATKFWNQEPRCPQGIKVKLMTVSEDIKGNIARAELGGCSIWINTKMVFGIDKLQTFNERCLVITHEYGHLLGKQHSEQGIMFPEFSATEWQVPECGKNPIKTDVNWIFLGGGVVAIFLGTVLAGLWIRKKSNKRLDIANKD